MVVLRPRPQSKERCRTKPLPTDARASGLPDCWKRGLWENCDPARNRKSGDGQSLCLRMRAPVAYPTENEQDDSGNAMQRARSSNPFMTALLNSPRAKPQGPGVADVVERTDLAQPCSGAKPVRGPGAAASCGIRLSRRQAPTWSATRRLTSVAASICTM